VRDWIKNHGRSIGGASDGKRKLLDLSAKRPKLLPAFQAYSKLHYDSLRPIVEERWRKAYLQKNPEHDPAVPIPPVDLVFRNKLLKDMLERESDAVKAQVEANRQQTRDDEVEIGDFDDEDLDNDEREKIKQNVAFNKYVHHCCKNALF
jgi:hypothetical protein